MNLRLMFIPGSKSYNNDTLHWAITSSQQSACSVEPGTAKDVGKIVSSVVLDECCVDRY